MARIKPAPKRSPDASPATMPINNGLLLSDIKLTLYYCRTRQEGEIKRAG